MPAIMISTTISQEIWNLAKEKKISWTEAMTRGILEISGTKLPAMKGEFYETPNDMLNATIKVRDALQSRLREVNKENMELHEKVVILEQKK